MADTQMHTSANSPTCMESVNRVAKLPVVEFSIQAATAVYEKLKEFNDLTHWTCNTAESMVNSAIEIGKPIATCIVQELEGPIKQVDGVLCSGLDYVETKIPAVKLPPGEMYSITKDYVSNTVVPVVGAAYSYIEPTVKTAYEKFEPAVETAKTVVEPALHVVEPVVEKAKTFVEPAVEKAKSIIEPAVESFKHYAEREREARHHKDHPEGDMECDECQATTRKMEDH